MPFKERSKVDYREEMVLRAIDPRLSVSGVARMYGVSRPTVRLWRRRYREEGRVGLMDRSHAPLDCPHRTGDEIVEAIIEKRLKYGWGSKKILNLLEREQPSWVLPARSTVDGILSREGLVKKSRRKSPRLSSPFKCRFEAINPGDLYTIDFKGEFRLGCGAYCYPLTMSDRVSRFILACQGLETTGLVKVWPVMVKTFREYGMPLALQSDNGPPFGAPNGKFSTLSARLMSYGIEPIFSRPAHPQDNGQHERMHRDLKASSTIPASQTFSDQQTRFGSFVEEYNYERPHEALSMKFPGEIFEPTTRQFPNKQPKPCYDEVLEKRKVSSSGHVKWKGEDIWLSTAFAGQTIGLEPIDERLWNVVYYEFTIGKLDEKNSEII